MTKRLGLLDWLQAGVTLVFFLFMFQGKGSHGVFLLGLLLLPVLRFSFDLKFRQAQIERYVGWAKQLMTAPNRPTVALFAWVAAPFLILLLGNGGTLTTQDNLPVKLTVSQLLTQGTLTLNQKFSEGCEGAANHYFVMCRDGKVLSKYPLGMATFLLPISGVAWLLGADLENDRVMLRLEKLTASLIAAACLCLFFLVACRIGNFSGAVFATILLGLGSSLNSIVGQALWTQGGVTLALLVIVAGEFLRTKETETPWVLLQGLAMSVSIACRLSSGVLVLVFGLWLAFTDFRRSIKVALVAIGGYLPWAMIHYYWFGSPFGPQLGLSGANYWTANPWPSFLGLLVSPSHGMFVYQPWVFVTVVLTLVSSRARGELKSLGQGPAGWVATVLLAFLAQLVLLSFWTQWHGGYSWGSRLMAPVLPLLGLLSVPVLGYVWRTTKGFGLALGIVSLWMHLGCVYSKATLWYVNVLHSGNEGLLWSWQNAPFLYPFWRGAL